MQGLLDAVVSVSSALGPDVVLRTAVGAARELVQARYGALGVLEENGEFSELMRGVHRRRSGTDRAGRRRPDAVLHELHGGPTATVVVARPDPAGRGRRLWWGGAGHDDVALLAARITP